MLGLREPETILPTQKMEHEKALSATVRRQKKPICSPWMEPAFSSEKPFSDHCLQKKSSRGKITYSLEMLGAAIVHPERKGVLAYDTPWVRAPRARHHVRHLLMEPKMSSMTLMHLPFKAFIGG